MVLQKLLLVLFCVVVGVLFGVFSIFCITSFCDCTHLRHKETTSAFKIYIYLTGLIMGCQH